jgi:maleylacetate reductase
MGLTVLGCAGRCSSRTSTDSATTALFDLARNHGAPFALRDLGMKEQDLDKACDIAFQNQYPNPWPLERAALSALLQNAFDGTRP